MERLQKAIFLVVKLDEEKQEQQQEEEESLSPIKGRNYTLDRNRESEIEKELNRHYESSSEGDGGHCASASMQSSSSDERREHCITTEQMQWNTSSSGVLKCGRRSEYTDSSPVAATGFLVWSEEESSHIGTVAEPSVELEQALSEEEARLVQQQQHKSVEYALPDRRLVSITNMGAFLQANEEDWSDDIGQVEEDEDGLHSTDGGEESEEAQQRQKTPKKKDDRSSTEEVDDNDDSSSTSYTFEEKKKRVGEMGRRGTIVSILSQGDMPTIKERLSESSDSILSHTPPPSPGRPVFPHQHNKDTSDKGRDHHRPATGLSSEPIATSSEPRLRATFRAQSFGGEELYGMEQYAMAIGCFNQAKIALLIIQGMSEGRKNKGQEPGPQYSHLWVKFRDQINSVSVCACVCWWFSFVLNHLDVPSGRFSESLFM